MPKPLLLLSDSPSSTTGLGRITRDLATRIHANMSDVFRVGCLGYGGPGSRHLPFPQYHIHSISNWLVPEIRDVWEDFAGDEKGILLTIWDPSRLMWLSQPDALWPDGQTRCPPFLRPWLKSKPFELWGYIPVDASGPNGKLSAQLGYTLQGYDRILAYSEWAAEIIQKTLGGKLNDPRSLPHGIDTSVWKSHPKADAKSKFRADGFTGLNDDSFLVGIVATNQARKDWALGIETCARLLQQGLDVRVWAHTDTLVRYWDIGALVEDFGLLGRVVTTLSRFTDEQMSWMYSACDVTLGIGLGEGFGYPIFESMACGTPCIHGNYGGASEHLKEPFLVTPMELVTRYEGQYNCVRPVWNAREWVDASAGVVIEPTASLPPELDWNNLWPKWSKWFTEGVK